MSEELEQLDTAGAHDIDFGAIQGIPNHLENLQEVIDAVEQFQCAIASDNDNEHTVALESWLSGQATAEMTREGSPLNDDDLDNDLIQRAQAEVSAALDMITQMLNDFEMPADQQVQLKAMQSELQSALGSRNPGQILQAAADIRSAQGTFGGLAAATRDYEELYRLRQDAQARSQALAEQVFANERDQREFLSLAEQHAEAVAANDTERADEIREQMIEMTEGPSARPEMRDAPREERERIVDETIELAHQTRTYDTRIATYERAREGISMDNFNNSTAPDRGTGQSVDREPCSETTQGRANFASVSLDGVLEVNAGNFGELPLDPTIPNNGVSGSGVRIG